MGNDSAESRRHRRIYFPGELVISGTVAASDAQAGFSVKILNLSEGGLFFTTAKGNGSHFQ